MVCFLFFFGGGANNNAPNDSSLYIYRERVFRCTRRFLEQHSICLIFFHELFELWFQFSSWGLSLTITNYKLIEVIDVSQCSEIQNVFQKCDVIVITFLCSFATSHFLFFVLSVLSLSSLIIPLHLPLAILLSILEDLVN